MKLKWGIVTVGKISHDFVNALTTLPSDDHVVIAAAARSAEDAKKFAAAHDIPKFYAGYELLAKDPEINVVYIGSVNAKHYELCKLYLEHGKHVLCEKPLCVNSKQTESLLKFAKEKKLFLMEAIWSRFFPSYVYTKEMINKGALGEITEVDVEFGFPLTEVEIVRYGPDARNLGGGTILDLGVYTIQVSLWGFNSQTPSKIEATGKVGENGVDIEMNGKLHFSNGGVANIRTSATKLLRNSAIIKGTKGQIELHDFWCPTTITDIDGKKKSWPLPEAKWEFVLLNSCGMRYEATEVKRCIEAGLLESSSVSHEESIRISKIQDSLRAQVGTKLPEDEMNF
uniref:Trans-1,2-dihydrobenzene-1,2-diol dehydrogenase n=1 Tax=Culicoides sonorensis TaxID=179676 RepID=A0A336MJ14_CULSO